MPAEIAAENLRHTLVALREHPLYPLQLTDLRDLAGFPHSQRSRLVEYCVLEEAVALLQDTCRGGQRETGLLSEKLPPRQLAEGLQESINYFRSKCLSWVAYLELWAWGYTEDQLAAVPLEGIDSPLTTMHFTKKINMHWTQEMLDQWASAWDPPADMREPDEPQFLGKVHHHPKDPGLVLTHTETGLKILLSADPQFVLGIARAALFTSEQVLPRAKEAIPKSGRPGLVAAFRSPVRPTSQDLELDRHLQELLEKSDYLNHYSASELYKRSRAHLKEWGFDSEYSGFRNRIYRLKKVLRVHQ
jgi:hypothetical protein